MRIRCVHLLCCLALPSVESSTAAASALEAFKSLDYRYFVAGGTCAAISHGITTPIDVVKTRIQANPKKYTKGMVQASLDIMKEDGSEVLLGGLGPTIVGYGIEGAMKFGVYEVMKPVFKALLSGGSGSGDGQQALAYLMASIVAGAVAAMLLCPMESTRIKIVTDPGYAGKSFIPAFTKLINEDGFLSTFGGIWAMLAKQVPYTFGKQVSFDMFASALYIFLHSLQENVSYLTDSTVKWAVSVIAAFCASIVACIFSQPGDMILTETYRPQKAAVTSSRRGRVGTPVPKPPQSTFSQIVGNLYKEGGVSQFFTGTQARIVHVGLIITSQLVIYDIVKQLLGLPATGSH
ncbi:hypothetical protein MPSEU_000166600 [Mayamaea pseudoterrestris]|nr:hypothetical protein MPSEU_000166600 [Mayamaea pseudoterrestris]